MATLEQIENLKSWIQRRRKAYERVDAGDYGYCDDQPENDGISASASDDEISTLIGEYKLTNAQACALEDGSYAEIHFNPKGAEIGVNYQVKVYNPFLVGPTRAGFACHESARYFAASQGVEIVFDCGNQEKVSKLTARVRYLPQFKGDGPYTVEIFRDGAKVSTTSYEEMVFVEEFCKRNHITIESMTGIVDVNAKPVTTMIFFRDLAIGEKFRFVGLDDSHPCAGKLATKVSALLFTCYVDRNSTARFFCRKIREDAKGLLIRAQARASIGVVKV